MELQWTPYLAVGVSKIDDQHIELFRRFNILYDALTTGEGRELLASTLTFLEDYVVVHFRMEEEVMDRYLYGEVSAHKAEHAYFAEEVASLKKQIRVSGYDRQLAVEILTQLGSWLQKHIGNTDQALGRFLRVTMAMHKAA